MDDPALESDPTLVLFDTPHRGHRSRVAVPERETSPTRVVRMRMIAIAVLVVIAINYQIYAGDSVYPQIIARFRISSEYYAWIGVMGAAFGALVAFAGRLADRVGRRPIVLAGLAVNCLLMFFGVPNSSGHVMFDILTVLVSIVGGIVIVAAAATIQDFSPRSSRARAMSLWIVATIIGRQIAVVAGDARSSWTSPYILGGVLALLVGAVAFFGLHDLAPDARERMATNLQDTTPIPRVGDGTAPGMADDEDDREPRRRGGWGTLVGATVAIALFLGLYYGVTFLFSVHYFIVSGLWAHHGNGVVGWYWIVNVIALLAAGVLSDLLGVRKPLIVVGCLVTALVTVILSAQAYHPMSNGALTVLLVLFAAGGGMAYTAVTAAYTETVERHHPTAVSGGLALFNALQRLLAILPVALVPALLLSYCPLLTNAPHMQAILSRYEPQLMALSSLSPATQSALKADPMNPQVQAQALAEIGAKQGLTPGDVLRVMSVGQKYGPQLAVLNSIDPTTAATLAANPNDSDAQNHAVADVSGGTVTPDDIARLKSLSQKYAGPLGVLNSIDPATTATLAKNPNDPNAQNQAVADVSGGTIAPSDIARLKSLSQQYAGPLGVLNSIDPATTATLAKNPNDSDAQNHAVADVSGGTVTPDDIARLKSLSQKYAGPLGVLNSIDPATTATLAKNPNDPNAQNQAVADVSGGTVTAADVAQVKAISQQYAAQLATVAAIDPATLAALQGPNALSAFGKALSDIAAAFKINQYQAYQRLAAVLQIPAADLKVLQTKGPLIAAAGGKLLQAQQAIPAADLAFLQSKGPAVQAAGAKLLGAQQAIPAADLAFLQAKGPAVQAAGAKLLAAQQAIPAADLAFLQAKGPAVQAAGAKLLAAQQAIPAADLAFLQAKGPIVQAAGAKLQQAGLIPAADTAFLQVYASQAQQWLGYMSPAIEIGSLIGTGASILLVLSLPLLVGRWSPRRARHDLRGSDGFTPPPRPGPRARRTPGPTDFAEGPPLAPGDGPY